MQKYRSFVFSFLKWYKLSQACPELRIYCCDFGKAPLKAQRIWAFEKYPPLAGMALLSFVTFRDCGILGSKE